MIRRYLSIWKTFAAHSLSLQMEYKGNFIFDLIIEMAWTLVSLFWIEVMFYHTDAIAGWSKGEVLLLYAIYRFGSGFAHILVKRNIFQFPRLINSGDLDVLLTKPVSVLFHTFFRMVAIDRFSHTFTSIGILLYSLSLLNWPLNARFILTFTLLIPLSALIRFAFEIIIVIPVFWLQKLQNVGDVSLILFNPARFPRQAFPIWFDRIFTFLLPVMMVGALPAEIILQKTSLWLLLVMGLMAALLLFIMHRFFYFALKHYSSASS